MCSRKRSLHRCRNLAQARQRSARRRHLRLGLACSCPASLPTPMRIFIEAKPEEVQKLADAGALKDAVILERSPLKRRQLSLSTEEELVKRLALLRAFKARFGSFDVPRSGDHADLGKWLDKLRQTYVKAPDGYRIDYLRKHALDVLAYLEDWSRTKVTKVVVRNAPFWLCAAWVAEFMEEKLCAPSQASTQPDEVALAKWLTRWTSAAALKKLKRKVDAYEVVAELSELAQMLRSRDVRIRAKATPRVQAWRNGDLYQRLARFCENDPNWDEDRERMGFAHVVEQRGRFWPTWLEWRGAQVVWKAKA